VLAPLYHIRLIFGTPRGIRIFLSSMLTAFGLISATVQFVGQLFPSAVQRPGLVMLAALVCCVVGGVVRAYPRRSFRRDFKEPEMTVTVLVGDLFDQDAHAVVVGFTDTFDTSVDRDRVISSTSVQGQLVRRRYDGDHRRLDRELRAALGRHTPVTTESRQQKPHGKLRRYAIGTVAVLGKPSRLTFAVAYSRMGNDLVARSTVNDIWISLNSLWEAVHTHAQQSRVAIPLIGSGLARISALERQNLLKMILLSFLARSRRAIVCRELQVVIRPADLDTIDILEVQAFLRSL
jgi:YD repeat-containing protein